ncbi:MAG: hypothetical protein IKH71_07690 [Oscillospiraceae bacterium]|nr:hypothetical protein [Oscillospiraceae bacterium]
MNASIRVIDKTGTVQTVYLKTLIANVDGLQATLDSKGEVSKVKVGSTSYSPSSGVVSLPAYPTTLPASDVSSWAKAASKPTYTASEVGAIASSAKGAASGVAELDSNGKVPTSQLPSYVDDVLEYSAKSSFPTTGETGKIYVDTSNNKTYRWSGSAYVEISPSLALGTTSSTAYRGDRGNTAYSHATDSSRLTTATSSGLYKVASTSQGHIASLTAVEKADITALGIPAQDTTYSAATTSTAGLMSASDKTKLNGIATGATANIGTVTQVKVGSTAYNPSSGVVSLPAYPTSLPASDVYSWAKASSKPSYTQDEVSDGSTYKRVSATEKTTWNNKQNALIIGDYSLDLNSLTYVQSASGMYYSTDVYVGAFNRIFSAMAYDFASLKTTDNVNIMISTDRKKIVILSNVNSFNPGAALELQIVGI